MSGRWVLLVVILSSVALVTGCGDPPTKVGDVCQIHEHCGGTEGAFPLQCDNSIPGGACMVRDCTADDRLTESPEDEGTCPDGSRCVVECPKDIPKCTEDESINVCRRKCDQQSDCGEVIVCKEVCETVEDVETCKIECKNEMECTPFWSPLPEPKDFPPEEELPEWAEDPPRSCILKGRLYKPPVTP